jgi:hypothetical protein
MNLLFWSRKCEMCVNLLKILQAENLINNFKLICVDDNLDKIPKNITRVPTMIVSGIPELLVAKQIFDWIQKVKFIRNQNINKQIIQQNLTQINNNNNNGPVGFKSAEMGSISDSFAYKDIDKALPQNYFGIGEEDKNVIFTAPEQQKINKKDQTNLIKDLQTHRTTQDKLFSSDMKNQQLHAIQNNL